MNAPDALPALFHPAIEPGDENVRRWLSQVTLRLRREIAWCWHQRAGIEGGAGTLPPPTDPAQDSMDLLRFHAEKRAFFATDATARYLSECIARIDPTAQVKAGGRWRQMSEALGLDAAAQFVLACAMAGRADASLGAVAASAMNDNSRWYPTLALAQRLWDDPVGVVGCADPSHPLYRSGLIKRPGARDSLDWLAPLEMPAPVAQSLLGYEESLPSALRELRGADDRGLTEDGKSLSRWLAATPLGSMQVVPVLAPRGADCAAWIAALARATGRRVAALGDDIAPDSPSLPGTACAAWLHGIDIVAPDHWARHWEAHEHPAWGGALAGIAARWFVPITAASAASAFDAATVAPIFRIPKMSTEQRADRLSLAVCALRGRGAIAQVQAVEAARSFRIEEKPLARVERVIAASAGAGAFGERELSCLMGAEATIDMGHLADLIEPRFSMDDLVLPPKQRDQVQAILAAARTLKKVHYEWGCARVWNEAALSLMLCGPPGGGKGATCEALAHSLRLPLYRIDLSQVINKYIGETEKNLRRVFDAAEAADCVLAFDEADVLFGKRSEVRDSHDRFANIEIGYLLSRIEYFKGGGLIALLTNRRKDLDEAFARRLRFIVELPIPGEAERALLWRRMFPPRVNVEGLDFEFLARSFEVTGGSIRSAAFNACLQAATRAGRARVKMADVLVSVRRELEKGGREISVEQFGPYAHLMRGQA